MDPVLVSNDPGVAEPPITGYIVIEHIVMSGMRKQPEVMPIVVRNAFSVYCKRAEVLIGIMQFTNKITKMVWLKLEDYAQSFL